MMSMFPRTYGLPRCSTCNKPVRTVWGSVDWHRDNDPIEGYCQCDNNPFKQMVDAAKTHIEETKVNHE
jgi:hypothetical protein